MNEKEIVIAFYIPQRGEIIARDKLERLINLCWSPTFIKPDGLIRIDIINKDVVTNTKSNLVIANVLFFPLIANRVIVKSCPKR